MQRISSGQTFFMKKVFPVLWIGLVCAFLLVGIAGHQAMREPMILVVPVLMVVVGIVVFRRFVWDLADEVEDGGDFLRVRKGGIEERVPLANVMNVSISQYTNPRRITLRLRIPGKLGDEIAFIPRTPVQFNPFARNPLAEALIQRVARLRRPA